MRMSSDAAAIKRRHRIASIIETKPGSVWPEPDPDFEALTQKFSPTSPPSRRSNSATVVDFQLGETPPMSPPRSATRLSVMRPNFAHEDDSQCFKRLVEIPEHHSLFDDSYDDLSSFYMEDRLEPFAYSPSLIFFLIDRYGAGEEEGTLPLAWSGMCLKMAALFNDIQLAVLHNHAHRYFSLLRSLISLTTRLLTLLPHTSQDGRVLLPRAREVVDTISRLVVELFEASGTWASGEDSLYDARFGDVSVATSLLAVRDFLQSAQYHSQPFNKGGHGQTPYLPLLVELQRMASLADYKYILRLDFLSARIHEASRNLLLVLATCGSPSSDRPSSTPALEHIGENSSGIAGLLDVIKFYIASVGHFLSLIRWVLMIPSDGAVSPTTILLRHLLGNAHELQQWAKLCLHTLAPTTTQRVSQLGLGHMCLDLAPWVEPVSLSQACLDDLIQLAKNPRHLEELSGIFPSLSELLGPSHEGNCSMGASSVHRILMNACLIRELRQDTEKSLEALTGASPQAPPATGPKARHSSGPISVLYHGDDSGRVRLATWDGLVELLAPKDHVVDSAFLRVFFLSFRAFATPHQLFYALTDKFDTSLCGGAVPINIRISNALLSWLELYFFDDDYHVVPLIKEFATSQLSVSVPAASQRLAEVSVRILDNQFVRSPSGRTSFKYQCLSLAEPDLSPISPTSRRNGFPGSPGLFSFRMGSQISTNPSSPLLEWGPVVLASSLTLIDADLFCEIRPQHIISYVMSKGKGSTASSPCPVKKLVDWSNQVNHWVVETILWEEDNKQRMLILKAFINLTERLVDMNNFNMAMAILSGLNSSAISRLHSTWGGLPTKCRSTVATHNHLFDPHRNFAAYRTKLRSIPNSIEPCVPFFGITLTDITFLLQGNPTYRSLSSIKTNLSQEHNLPFSHSSLRIPRHKEVRLSHIRHHSEGVASAPNLPSHISQAAPAKKASGSTPPWEPLPEVEFINFDKFYRLVQVLDNLEERQAVPYSFPNLENPHTTAQVLKEHIYTLPSTPKAPSKSTSVDPPPLARLASSHYSLEDILLSAYEIPLQEPSPSHPRPPPTAAAPRQAQTTPSLGSPVITFTMTMEDYYQKSLRLEPPNSPF
ncbi:Ras guanine nucleotide exchange factor bud5 [Entomophthora muscae]|uniref:Ras guanine nucleotide exchange factor bud5 n=1 Tax=Entomophthora muscae TaxID=34485 RepID=A0ACC2TYI9_9FUNG|nr:Ras guanine nucleotide exchange factor bud5 [Entomophthora muscae]